MPVVDETDFSQAVLEEAKQEAEEIVDRARREAERILEGAREELDKIYIAESPQTRKQQAITHYNQIVSAAELETRRKILLAREQYIQEVQEQIKAQFWQLRNEQHYARLLWGLIRDALLKIEGEAFEVIVAPEDRELVTQQELNALCEQTGKTVTLSKRSHEGITGAIIQRVDQRVRCDNSLQAILQREQHTVRLLIAQELFGEVEE
jgi:vacuolar-type H+-ATPase subunit E/Vma4